MPCSNENFNNILKCKYTKRQYDKTKNLRENLYFQFSALKLIFHHSYFSIEFHQLIQARKALFSPKQHQVHHSK